MARDTIWIGLADDKCYKQSGFTTTVTDSFSVTGTGEGSPTGISRDGSSVLWVGYSNQKVYKATGFTSTVADSFSTAGFTIFPTGCSWDGANVLLCGATKLYQTAGFTATLTSSTTITGIDASPRGASWDGVNPLISGDGSDKIASLSGFTTTVVDSYTTTSVDTTPRGCEWEPFGGLGNLVWTGQEADQIYKNTGFTTTVEDSISIGSVDTGIRDVSFSDFGDSPAAPIDPVYASRVKETSTTTGTGTLDLAGAVTGFQTFVDGVGDGNKTTYYIEAVDGDGVPTGDWEHGYGTVTDAATDTLSRDEVIESSNGGELVNFSAGNKNVYMDAGPRSFMEAGCKVYLSSNQSISSGGNAAIDWDTEEWDPFDMHEGVTHPSRIVASVPGRYCVLAQVVWDADSLGRRDMTLTKNGIAIGGDRQFDVDASIPKYQQVFAEVELSSGDYVELQVYQNSGSALNARGNATVGYACWMSVQRQSA